ncbi:MAG TPA: hypothetical protein VD884_17565 [Ohtaekwangia sp.]|nr:hypothetical protein [Ohtaekwangia sp.]
MEAIFSEDFVSRHIQEFRLSSIPGIRDKSLLLHSLIGELESGKLGLLKEEEVKSRFINQFFGDILGFNYGNSTRWLLREERKSNLDGTKPDAALGFFSLDDDLEGDVRAVVEMKSFNTDLGSKQNRTKDKRTPIEQAFSYAVKTGGNCKWVIVSNMREIRFYPSSNWGKCQKFYLADLKNEEKFRELLFFFHKDRFIKKDSASNTDILFELSKRVTPIAPTTFHIIDKLFNCLKPFDGFGYVDPNFLATLHPFNILNETVWHYNRSSIFTINTEIYELLTMIEVIDGQLSLNPELEAQVVHVGVVDAHYKLDWCFRFMNQCNIKSITAVRDYKLIEERNKKTIGFSLRRIFGYDEGNGQNKGIDLRNKTGCDCLFCNYRAFEVRRLLNKLKAAQGDSDFLSLEYAYGNYLLATDNYKTCYLILKELERKLKGQQGKAIEYFLVKKSLKNLSNALTYYDGLEKERILNDVRNIDLDKAIYDEIEYEVNKDVKAYLIQVKEDDLIYRVQDEMDAAYFQIERLKEYYQGKTGRPKGFVDIGDMEQNYISLYQHVHQNFIVYESYRRYQYMAEKMFFGLLTSTKIPELKLEAIPAFYIRDAVQNIPSVNLKEALADIDHIPVTQGGTGELLKCFKHFLDSYYTVTLFNDPQLSKVIQEQRGSYNFVNKMRQFASNFFATLSRIEFTAEEFRDIPRSLVQYISVETELYWPDIDQFAEFLDRKAFLFSEKELLGILTIAIDRDENRINKYHKLIPKLAEVIRKNFPNCKISDTLLVEKALLKCRSTNSTNYRRVIPLATISSDICKRMFFTAFEKKLDQQFDPDFYETLIDKTDYSINNRDYFQKYVVSVNNGKDKNTYRWGKNEYTDVVFFSFLLLINKKQISRKRKEFKSLVNLNDFERWLLYPTAFDYSIFRVEWLLEISATTLVESLKGNRHLIRRLKSELKGKFDKDLAEIINVLDN